MVQVEDLLDTAILERETEEEVCVMIPETFPDMLQRASEGMPGGLRDGLIDGIAAYCIRCESESRTKETLDGRDSA